MTRHARNRPFEDLTGRRFGLWTVLRPEKVEEANGLRARTRWVCRCVCGTERRIVAVALKRGRTRSCGCQLTSHGLTKAGKKHPIYIAWSGMWNRCTNVHDPGYANYGGRGIRVCDRWQDAQAFIKDMGPSWKVGLSLDRINVNGIYSPENCRWADRKTQNGNRRNVLFVDTADGPLPLKEACRRFAVVDYTTVRYRLRHGWSLDSAMQKPAGAGR